MNEDLKSFIVFLSASLLAGAIIGIAFYISHRRKKIVAANSRKIPLVEALNTNYSFHKIAKTYYMRKNCVSKRDFDRTDFLDFAGQCMMENLSWYRELLSQLSFNQTKHAFYSKQFNDILNQDTEADKELYSKYRFFKRYEERFCLERKLNPTISLEIEVSKYYTSPKGNKSYSAQCVFQSYDIARVLEKCENTIKYRNTAMFQRSLMTDSLRYDVMKRDGFKCVLCGATQADGVKLHVDHIFPVSKGGKTEMSNLRTLCARCNLGKKAKYDPFGKN